MRIAASPLARNLVRLAQAALCTALMTACNGDGKRPRKVETEKTLRGPELARRKAYSSEAKSTAAMISSRAQDANLCHSAGAKGKVGPTPPMTVDCNASETGRCVPSRNPKHPWEYDIKLWNDDIWKAVDFTEFAGEGHRYHSALEWKTLEDGDCEVRARVFGDLDNDGVYSTFEMVGTLPGPDEWDGEMIHYTNPLE